MSLASKASAIGHPVIPFHLIVCATKLNGIGQAGRLPWRLKEDMKFFKNVTTLAPPNQTNVVIMGRKTWQSIPARFRPLPDRINVVVSRQAETASETLGINPSQNSYLVDSINAACELIGTLPNVHRVFLIGGAELYRTVLESRPPYTQYRPTTILLTRITSDNAFEPPLDAFFPEIRPEQSNCLPDWSLSDRGQLMDYLATADSLKATEILANHPTEEVHEGDFRYQFELWTNQTPLK